MKVYLAAPYAARDQMRSYRDELAAIGIKVTSGWLAETHDINAGTVGPAADLDDNAVNLHASGDFRDIDKSDLLVVFSASASKVATGSSNSGGRHVETGYALAKSKPVLVVGEPENIFQRSSYCWKAKDWHEAVLMLASVYAERLREEVRPA